MCWASHERALMLGEPTEVARLDGHADFGRAVPTPDHFLPLQIGRASCRERVCAIV